MRFLKFAAALLLLPLLAAVAGALLDLSHLLWATREWGHPWVWALGGGLLLWLIVWLLLPRPVWIYVLGHELTHALAVYLHAGKVYRFAVTKQGGHIVSDKNNWFIALAPYFIPLYALIWIALWWSVNFYYPLGHYAWLLYGGIGVAWGFHLTFTVSMIRDGQSDLAGQGVFFSLVLILLLNLLLIEGGLAAVSTRADFGFLGRSLRHRTVASYQWTGHTIAAGATEAWREIGARVARRRALP